MRSVNLKKLSYADGMLFAFNGCTALELVDFSEAIAIPNLGGNSFTNTNETFKIIVPDALYNDWIAYGYWVSVASHIVAKSDYEGGE